MPVCCCSQWDLPYATLKFSGIKGEDELLRHSEPWASLWLLNVIRMSSLLCSESLFSVAGFHWSFLSWFCAYLHCCWGFSSPILLWAFQGDMFWRLRCGRFMDSLVAWVCWRVLLFLSHELAAEIIFLLIEILWVELLMLISLSRLKWFIDFLVLMAMMLAWAHSFFSYFSCGAHWATSDKFYIGGLLKVYWRYLLGFLWHELAAEIGWVTMGWAVCTALAWAEMICLSFICAGDCCCGLLCSGPASMGSYWMILSIANFFGPVGCDVYGLFSL